MEIAEFEKLLKRLEDETIDFKAENYVFGGSTDGERRENRAKFLKDIICMWNTPREIPAYIILGVKKNKDGSYDLTGINDFIDDAIFQQQLHGNLYPVPTVETIPIIYKNKKFVALKIPIGQSKGPVLAIKSFGEILRSHQVYHRLKSSNAMADQQAQHEIYKWFRQAFYKTPASPDESAEWENFISHVNNFSPLYKYILVVDRISNISAEDLAVLGLIDWTLVIDFDPLSEADGLLFSCKEAINQHRSLHLLVKGDRPNINSSTATYWYFANGITGRESTLIKSGKWIDWNNAYKRDIDQLLESFAKKINPLPVCCIIIWPNEAKGRFLDSVLSTISSTFGDSVSNIILTSTPSESLEKLNEDYNASIISMPLSHLCSGIRNTKAKTEEQVSLIPSSTGTPLDIPKKKLVWLEEELEIVTLNAGQICPEGRQPGRDFLRGNEISWYDLGGIDKT